MGDESSCAQDRVERVRPRLGCRTLGALPGMSALATRMMAKQMEKLDIPPIGEFLELISDSGAGLYACKATVDMFGLTKDSFVPQVDDVITVGEFYEKAAGGQIVFT